MTENQSKLMIDCQEGKYECKMPWPAGTEGRGHEARDSKQEAMQALLEAAWCGKTRCRTGDGFWASTCGG